jgi:hypothetical protein
MAARKPTRRKPAGDSVQQSGRPARQRAESAEEAQGIAGLLGPDETIKVLSGEVARLRTEIAPLVALRAQLAGVDAGDPPVRDDAVRVLEIVATFVAAVTDEPGPTIRPAAQGAEWVVSYESKASRILRLLLATLRDLDGGRTDDLLRAEPRGSAAYSPRELEIAAAAVVAYRCLREQKRSRDYSARAVAKALKAEGFRIRGGEITYKDVIHWAKRPPGSRRKAGTDSR